MPTTPEFRTKLVLDDSDLSIKVSAAERSATELITRVQATAAAATSAIGRTGAQAASSAKLTRQELLALNYTASDVAASLASGASPFTILLQQGGQVRDAFGGFGNLFSKLSSALSLTRVAGAGLVGVFAGVATAAYQGWQESRELNKAIQLTGNYSAATSSRVDALVQSLSQVTGRGAGAARESLQALIASGTFGPQQLEDTAKAVIAYREATGKTAEEAVQEFARMQQGVAKWAAEHNRSMHFITGEQYAYIKQLEDQGRQEEAMRVTSRLLYEHLGTDAPKNLGYLERAWKAAGKAISDAWDAAKGFGREDTAEEKIARLQAAVAANQRIAKEAREANAAAGMFPMQANVVAERNALARAAQFQGELDRMRTAARVEAAAADKKASDARVQQQRIEAQDYLEQLRAQTDGTARAAKAIDEYRRKIASLKGTAQEVSPEQQKIDEAALRKRFDSSGVSAGRRLDDAFQDRLRDLTAEGIKLDAQVEAYGRYGRALDTTRTSVLALDIAQGKLKGLSPAQVAALERLAKINDAKELQVNQARAVAATDKRIEALKREAEARAMNARETEIAQRLSQVEADGLDRSSEAYKRAAEQIRKWVDVKHDGLLARQLAEDERRGREENARLDLETKLIGANTLERSKALAVLELEAQARARLADNPGQRDAIEASLARQKKDRLDALQRNYDESRSFEAGTRRAMTEYREQVEDQSKRAADLFQQSMSKMEDALVSFAKTGKLELKDLLSFFVDNFLRQGAQGLLSSVFGDPKSGGGSIFSSIFGGGGSGGGLGSIFTSAGSGIFGGIGSFFSGLFGRASGGDVRSRGAYEVAERGPELLKVGQRTFLLMGNQPGQVQQAAGGSAAEGGRVNYTHVDQRQFFVDTVTQRGLAETLKRADRAQQAQLNRARNRGRA